MSKHRLVCAAAALAALASGTALADATANVGLMSNYIYRGVYQSDASAFGGIDIQADTGFYLGTWGIDVQNGIEYDIYLGYRGGGERFQWNTGFTGYYYTDDFDSTYEEFNLGLNYGFLTLDYALGEYHVTVAGDAQAIAMGNGIQTPNGARQTYQYVGATFTPEIGPYYFLGRTDYMNVQTPDMSGRVPYTGKSGYWVEIGKDFEVADGLDIGIKALYSFDIPSADSHTPSSIVLSGTNRNAEYATVLTITKTIQLMSR